MPYIPSPTRYDSMLYRRCGRSGLKLPAISLGLWHNFGFDKSKDSMRAICRAAFDLGVTHFDLANNYGPPPGLGGGRLRRHSQGRFPFAPRRARDLDQGWLRHVAGPLWRVGQPQVPAGQPRPEPEAHGPRLCRHLLFPPLRSRDAARGDDGRARYGRAPGQGALCRHLLLQFAPHPGGLGDPQKTGHALPHPPAELLAAQPLDRGRRSARHAGGRGHRRHRVLAAGAGDADGQISERRSGRQPRGRGRISSIRSFSRQQTSTTCAISTQSPSGAGSRWRRWRWPGCCATSA